MWLRFWFWFWEVNLLRRSLKVLLVVAESVGVGAAVSTCVGCMEV